MIVIINVNKKILYVLLMMNNYHQCEQIIIININDYCEYEWWWIIIIRINDIK